MDPGDLPGGRYRLGQFLGRGGMGEVWAAEDTVLRRPVAVKIMLASLGTDRELAARLRLEAQAAAGLQHPGITVVHDFGDHEGRPYFVMELLHGNDLASLLAGRADGLDTAEVLRLMIHVADALAHAHDNGVVHRDIKPANLMRLADGNVKICDFGIARVADATRLTVSGAVLGTPAFMAPEQFDGRPADARTDLYAFGATLFTLLTGRPPFARASLAQVMYQHLHEDPPRLSELRPDIPRGMDDILRTLLAKDPANRPASARQVHDLLRSILADQKSPLVCPPAKPPEFVPVRRHEPRRRSYLRAMALSPAGQAWASVSDNERLSLHDMTTGSDLDVRVRGGGHTRAAAFSPDGQKVAAGYQHLHVWDADNGRRLIRLSVGGGSLAFRKDGHTLALGPQIDGEIVVFDVRNGARMLVLPGHPGIVRSLAFSPDGHTLASTGGGEYGYEALCLWDVGSGERLHQITGKTREVHSAVFHPSGDLVATGDGDDRVRIWDVRTGQLVRELTGHLGPIRSIAYSPDGTILAGGGFDQMIHLWDVGTGEHVHQLTGHSAIVLAVAFTSAGNLASGSQDGTVIIWETREQPV